MKSLVWKWSLEDNDASSSYFREQLKRIADETGGTLFKADRAEDLDGVYQRVASELQTLYSVSYNPADKNYDGQWRNVGVKVRQGAAMARTKRGFYARWWPEIVASKQDGRWLSLIKDSC